MITRMNKLSIMKVHRIIRGIKNIGEDDNPQVFPYMHPSSSVSIVSFMI